MVPLPGLLPVRPPHAAERTVFGASTNGLHRSPHILFRIHQVPARGQEVAAGNLAAFIDSLRLAGQAIDYRLAPGNVAVSGHHRMSLTQVQSLFRKQGGVNSAVDHPRPTAARHPAHFVAAQGVARMNADADDIARLDGFRHHLLQRLID